MVWIVSVTDSAETGEAVNGERPQLSLDTAAARNLATTTKTVPQMQEITSRWLLRTLPWVQVNGGTYRVNRRLTYVVGDGRITFVTTGTDVRVLPQELGEIPVLRGFADESVLSAMADRFTRQEFAAGDVIVERGTQRDRLVIIVHGRANKTGVGDYGDRVTLGTLADGEFFGTEVLTAGDDDNWDYTVTAVTGCTVLSLERQSFQELNGQSDGLREHIRQALTAEARPQNRYGEAAIDLASGHHGEPDLPGTYVAYEPSPREYQLSVSQTVLRVHSRVADLFNDPMNQVEEQLRLTVEALRERQEHEMVNNPDIGLLHNVDYKQRIHTRSGPPTPDDLDELLALVWKSPAFFLAHPRTIAAFGRECTRAGVYPQHVDVAGVQVPGWRGVPILSCNKIGVSDTRTSSILLMRTGEATQGVVGLHQTGIPDEYQPSLNVRFMGVNEKGIISYLASVYYSVAVLVPDAIAMLENCEIGKES